MKFLIVILFNLLALHGFSQDTCTIQFASSNVNISIEQQEKINAFLQDKSINKVTLVSYVFENEAVSASRIDAEWRTKNLRELFMNRGVPFNKIESAILLTENSRKKNQIDLAFSLTEKNGEKILKKTPVVQISEVDLRIDNRSLPVVVKEKPKEKKFLTDQAFKKNEKITLPNLLFEPGTHYLLPGSEEVLNELLDIMKSNPKLRIELQGHICCKLGGVDGYDPTTGLENLSQMRAKAVYSYLLDRGIEQFRMKYRGFGSSQKLYEDDMVNRMSAMRNRRVEVLVIEAD